MSFIRPNARSTVWKTFGATPGAWNGTRPNHARELTCSGGRVGCSASRKELHATRVPPQEMKLPLPPWIIAPIASSVEAAVPAALIQTALDQPLRAISSVKLSLRLKSPPPQEMERWLPQASRSSTRLRKGASHLARYRRPFRPGRKRGLVE